MLDNSQIDLNAYWMPFTANRQFKSKPRLMSSAKDMHYTTTDGRQVLDGTAGLWCVNAGHCRDKIVKAVQNKVAELDYSPAFQMGHPDAFELATRLTDLMGGDFDQVFYTNSGSESVETALKIALAYQRVKGQGSRFRLIGRERGYHGVGFGGLAVGGLGNNRKMFGPLVPAPTTCPIPTTLKRMPSAAASRNGARIWPTISNASSHCMTPRPSPPSSSSRWPVRPVC